MGALGDSGVRGRLLSWSDNSGDLGEVGTTSSSVVDESEITDEGLPTTKST